MLKKSDSFIELRENTHILLTRFCTILLVVIQISISSEHFLLRETVPYIMKANNIGIYALERDSIIPS